MCDSNNRIFFEFDATDNRLSNCRMLIAFAVVI